MNNQDELKKAVETARRVHEESTYDIGPDAVVVGALIRAVEILAADQSPGVRKLIEAPTNEPKAFPDELVKRLVVAHRNAIRERLSSGQSAACADGIRAVLSELAKAPVNLPSAESMAETFQDALAQAYNRYGDRVLPWCHVGTESRQRLCEAMSIVHSSIATILAAKDAQLAEQAKRIEELKKDAEEKQATAHAHIVRLEKRLDERSVEPTKELRDKTIALDESNSFMNDAGVPYSQLTCERVRMLIESRDAAFAKLAELTAQSTINEKQINEHIRELLEARPCEGIISAIERQKKERAEERRAIRLALGQTSEVVGTYAEDVAAVVRERDELRAKLAPVIVDGKTPGQELHHRLRHSFDSDFVGLCKPWEFLGESTQRAMERIAASVIRAFGGEALRRVRDRIAPTIAKFNASGLHGYQLRDEVTKAIDDELAKLSPTVPIP